MEPYWLNCGIRHRIVFTLSWVTHFLTVLLGAAMLDVVLLGVVMLSVFMLIVVMLSVVAPYI